VGLEDDYDMGISFEVNPDKNLKLFFSYFRQAEPEGPIFSGDVTFGNAGAGRYSYDVTSHTYQSLAGNNVNIRELNQLNTRATYSVKENCEIGFSAQVGGIYNSELEKAETSTAFAGHFVGEFNKISVLQSTYSNPGIERIDWWELRTEKLTFPAYQTHAIHSLL
ncbi:MAG: hypothetical protein ACQER7_10720, partial [Bacteroidota bacterium]